MHVYARKDLRVGFGTFGIDLQNTFLDRAARPAQDVHHIETAAAAKAQQHHFHGAGALVMPARLGRTIHDDPVTAIGLPDEACVLVPDHPRAHAVLRSSLTPLPEAGKNSGMTMTTPPRQRPEWLDAFLHHSRVQEFPARTRLIQGGDPSDSLYYLLKGSVSVMIEDSEGHELVLAYLNEGEFFGEMGLFDPETQRSACVMARTDCTVAQADYEHFLQMSEHTPAILLELASQMAGRLRRTSAKVRDLAFLDVTGRIARTLLDLARQPDAMTHPDGMQIRVTRQEIARIVGCSREMAGRVLKDLEDQGLISAHGKTMVIFGTR